MAGLVTGGYGRDRKKPRAAEPAREEKPRFCPLCNEALQRGQKVKSVVYPGKPDSRMEIFGCPCCYPSGGKTVRICPVCRAELPPEAYVLARMFQKPGKTHVHVLGCTLCYGRKIK